MGRCIVVMKLPVPLAHSCGPLNHLTGFRGGVFKLTGKFDSDSLLCSPSHFERGGHTVHTLPPQRLPPPLTNSVKLSLFPHALLGCQVTSMSLKPLLLY